MAEAHTMSCVQACLYVCGHTCVHGWTNDDEWMGVYHGYWGLAGSGPGARPKLLRHVPRASPTE